MAAEDPPLRHVLSLQQAAVLYVTEEGPRRILVKEVKVRHGAAMLEVLSGGVRRHHWVLVGDVAALHQTARLHAKVTVAIEAALPLLDIDPTSVNASRILTGLGWAIRHVGRKIDYPAGNLYAAAASTGNLLRRHATHITHGDRGIDWLRDNIPILRARLNDLLETSVLLPADFAGHNGGAV